MRVLVIFLLFHFLIDKILSKQGCPETPIELSEQEAHLVDITIMLANKENYLFSSPLLDKMKNSFMICKPNPNNIDLINHTLPKRYLVNYKAAEVYARPYQLFLFYPLTNMINGRCPFSRYLTVNLKCPRKMNFQRKPISVGKDMCDLTFVIYEPQACFINFTIDFDHQMYKNFSFEDVKLSNVIVILFLLSAFLFSVGAILMLILHFCADYVEGSHPQIQDSNNEKVSITNSLSTEEHLATTNLTTSTKKDESQS